MEQLCGMENLSKFNNSAGWNNYVRWKFFQNSIIEQDEIIDQFATNQNSHCKKIKVQIFCEDHKKFENISHFILTINSKFSRSINHNDGTFRQKINKCAGWNKVLQAGFFQKRIRLSAELFDRLEYCPNIYILCLEDNYI